jgi:hypothetical protein
VRNVALVGAAAIAACGRLGFDDHVAVDAARTDAAIDAPREMPGLVAMTSATAGSNVASFDVTIPEVTAGDLLIVGIAGHYGVPIASISDGSGRQLTSAGVFAEMASTSSEIWYEPQAAATTLVTINASMPTQFDVWIAEFSGTHAGPPVDSGSNCREYPPSLVTAPGTTTTDDELVFSVTMFAYPLFVSEMLPPFTGFSPLSGNDAGFYIAPAPGSYGTQFEIAMGSGMAAMTCASTAVWPPGP